jgi:hypothetical protein
MFAIARITRGYSTTPNISSNATIPIPQTSHPLVTDAQVRGNFKFPNQIFCISLQQKEKHQATILALL